jgi:hypothetical protein
MSTWLINDATPESFGVEVMGGQFRSGAASSVQLRCTRNFDAAELFAYGATVTIKRDGVKFFTGKVRATPKAGSADAEGHDYLVEDLWADLERTVYQESWLGSDGAALMPRCFLGVNAAGTRINLGTQIGEALDFAIACGIGVTKGNVPTGMLLWPTEVDSMSIAEVIRTSLRYHPDWIPWIDHTTSPNPTFHVTPRATADAMSIAVGDVESFDVTELQDRLPDCVRVVFVTTHEVDGNVSRKISTQKFPLGGADSGPGVLTTTVDLQGVNASIQKQQIWTRHIPTTLTDSTLAAKAWLKLNYPAIKDIADAKLDLSNWARGAVAETETPPPPINPASTRLPTSDLSLLPRQLIGGNVAEWMRKRVGKVRLSWTLAPGSTATEAEAKLIAQIPKGVTVTATNAITKIYRGISSSSPAESAPAGIAEAYYNTIRNGCRYEGRVSLVTSDLSGRWHGKKLNLTGGVSAWASMAAPIHSVDWDAQNETANISFGPNPEFAFQDYVEYLKLLRRRGVNWITSAERAGSELGDESGASAAGDNIGPMDTPEDIPEFSGGGETFSHPFKITTKTVDGVPKYKVAKGSIQDGTNGSTIALTGITETDRTATAGYVVLEADVDAGLVVSGWALVIKTAAADTQEIGLTTSGEIRQNKLRLLLGKLTLAGDVATPWQAWFTSARVGNGLLNGVAVRLIDAAPTLAAEI